MNEEIAHTKKGAEWKKFALEVLIHVDTYTVFQCGDTGNDRIDELTKEDCIKAIQRYCHRFGRNARSGNDKLDMLKIAHYACFIYNKLKDEEESNND